MVDRRGVVVRGGAPIFRSLVGQSILGVVRRGGGGYEARPI